jgi:hypothetical protein
MNELQVPAVCWIDTSDEATQRLATGLREHASHFEGFWIGAVGQVDGITMDPVQFAMASYNTAKWSDYIQWHPRVFVSQELAAPGVTGDEGELWLHIQLTGLTPGPTPDWEMPDEPVPGNWLAPGVLELRWTITGGRLPTPKRPAEPGVANLDDAKRAIAVVVDLLNGTAGPVLAGLERAMHGSERS